MDVYDQERLRQGEKLGTGDFIDWVSSKGQYGTLENPGLSQVVDNWFTGALDYKRELALQEQAQAYNAEQARLEYERSKELRSTAYQDAVQDMKSAGLNPYLSYVLGSGGSAATPSISAARSGSSGHRPSGLSLRDMLTFIAAVVGTASSVAASSASSANVANRLKFDERRYSDFMSGKFPKRR